MEARTILPACHVQLCLVPWWQVGIPVQDLMRTCLRLSGCQGACMLWSVAACVLAATCTSSHMALLRIPAMTPVTTPSPITACMCAPSVSAVQGEVRSQVKLDLLGLALPACTPPPTTFALAQLCPASNQTTRQHNSTSARRHKLSTQTLQTAVSPTCEGTKKEQKRTTNVSVQGRRPSPAQQTRLATAPQRRSDFPVQLPLYS